MLWCYNIEFKNGRKNIHTKDSNWKVIQLFEYAFLVTISLLISWLASLQNMHKPLPRFPKINYTCMYLYIGTYKRIEQDLAEIDLNLQTGND